MIEYTKGSVKDKSDIIDFINYVFSQLAVPHDFKMLMPKLYADDVKELKGIHYLVKKNEKIQAVMMNHVIEVCVCDRILKVGMIGNVSVHPYARGKGYMKQLMKQLLDEAKQAGVDILVLSGKRQRYGYFGFENAGSNLWFTVNRDNIRHCLSNIDCSEIYICPMQEASENEIAHAVKLYNRRMLHSKRKEEEFQKILQTWNCQGYIIYKRDKMIGYMCSDMNEIVLEEEANYALILKYLFDLWKLTEVSIKTAPFEKERASFLSNICECSKIEMEEMIQVLSWENVLTAFMELKSKTTTLHEGMREIVIEKDVYQIKVEDQIPSVKRIGNGNEEGICLSNKSALRKVFGIDSLVMPEESFYNWFPLPFFIDKADVC